MSEPLLLMDGTRAPSAVSRKGVGLETDCS